MVQLRQQGVISYTRFSTRIAQLCPQGVVVMPAACTTLTTEIDTVENVQSLRELLR
jgi:hypothetical protein